MNQSKGALQRILIHLVYLSPFVFPLYLVKFKVYGIPFTVLEVLTYVLFGLYLISLIVKTVKIEWGKPSHYYYLFAFFLFMGATLGVFMAPHFIPLPSGDLLDSQMVALGVWKGWVVAPLLYFFVLAQVIRDSKSTETLLRSFVYSGAFVCLLSYGFGMFNHGVTYDLRLSGFFESANYLSLYIVPPLLLGIYFLLHSKKSNLLNTAAVTIMAHALFFTQSYAAIIGVFGALGLYVLYLIIKERVSLYKIFIGLIVLLITFGAIIGSQLNTRKFKQFLDWENRSSTSVRLEIYEVAVGLISEYPLTGVGPGLFQANYQTKGPEILEKAPMEWNMPHPHNIFFAFWLNAGLLGLLALIFIIILAHTRFTYPLIAFWGLLIHGLFDTPFWKNDLAMIFWLIIASILILQTYGTHSPKIAKAPIRKRLAPRIRKSAKAKRL